MIDIEKLKAAIEFQNHETFTEQDMSLFDETNAHVLKAAQAYLAIHEGMDEANKMALGEYKNLVIRVAALFDEDFSNEKKLHDLSSDALLLLRKHGDV